MKALAVFAVLLFAAAATSAAGLTMDTVLQGDLGTLSLRAEATWDGSSWLYAYALNCDSIGSKMVHVFTLDNPSLSEYYGAGNDVQFENPAWPESAFLEWRNVTQGLAEGQSAIFSFRSLFEPAETPVFVMVVNGGTAAWGETLGMSDRLPGQTEVIPEAGSLCLAAMGLSLTSAVRPLIGRRA